MNLKIKIKKALAKWLFPYLRNELVGDIINLYKDVPFSQIEDNNFVTIKRRIYYTNDKSDLMLIKFKNTLKDFKSYLTNRKGNINVFPSVEGIHKGTFIDVEVYFKLKASN